MPTYVRKKGSDEWHWCTNCSNYPTGPDVSGMVTMIPFAKILLQGPYGKLCNECKAKEEKGDCKQ